MSCSACRKTSKEVRLPDMGQPLVPSIMKSAEKKADGPHTPGLIRERLTALKFVPK